MKLEECLKLAKEKRGFTNLNQCVLYVELNAKDIFITQDNIIKELNELYADLKEKEPEYFYENYRSCR